MCDEVRDALTSWAVAFIEVDASDDADRFLRTPVVDLDGREIAAAPIDLVSLRHLVC